MTTKQRVNKIGKAVVAGNPKTYEDLCKIVNPITPKNWGWSAHWDARDRIERLSFYDGNNRNCQYTMPETINCKIATQIP